ncbi:MAG: S-layer homology domain-containing protein [Oscillospiraceae bacterium]|nr:S-layer homology domain-containing protein [Oscillospiraceae bacterium]
MKKLKRFGALVLTLILALSLAVPAFAAVEDTGYSDVDADAAYAEAVVWCREQNLMVGEGNDRFDPEGNLTRAALATVLYRMEGEPTVTGEDSFTDTAVGVWYSNAILWASQQELMGGYGDGMFGTNDPKTRPDIVSFILRYEGEQAVEAGADFHDEADIADYASTAVDWAVANGIASSASDGAFAPRTNATRAQIAIALMNYDRTKQTAPTTPAEPDPAPAEGGRVLIAYFSATNNTEGIANHLNAILDADLYEITPETPYTSADLNYNTDCRANREQNDPTARPAISGSVDNMEQYDVIFLGYPIWWGQAPKIISTFLESYDLSGKTIIPFCTSGSSPLGSSATNLHSLAPAATWLDGQRFSGSAPRSTVENWVNSLVQVLKPGV